MQVSPDAPRRLRRGEEITASWLNRLARLASKANRLVAGKPLDLQLTGEMRRLRWVHPRPITALITGYDPKAGAYSWSEAYHFGNSSWLPLPGGRSGVSNAYEANGYAQVPTSPPSQVELKAGYLGGQDWRFQWLRMGQSQVVAPKCNGNPTCFAYFDPVYQAGLAKSSRLAGPGVPPLYYSDGLCSSRHVQWSERGVPYCAVNGAWCGQASGVSGYQATAYDSYSGGVTAIAGASGGVTAYYGFSCASVAANYNGPAMVLVTVGANYWFDLTGVSGGYGAAVGTPRPVGPAIDSVPNACTHLPADSSSPPWYYDHYQGGGGSCYTYSGGFVYPYGKYCAPGVGFASGILTATSAAAVNMTGTLTSTGVPGADDLCNALLGSTSCPMTLTS